MISFEEPKYGLVLTIMEWHRLSTNGILRIGDRIRRLGNHADIRELINLAPDLGEDIDDYVIARLSGERKIQMGTISPDNPALRLLCLSDIESFHIMTQNARANLEDRGKSYGIELKDPLFNQSEFSFWQKDTWRRALAFHANRIKRGFKLPPSKQDRLDLIATALHERIDAEKSNGTPAYGWAVALQYALKGSDAFKSSCTSVLKEMQKIPFAAETFFLFDVNSVRLLAQELENGLGQKTGIPLAGMAWINQIGHQHYRNQPPTSETFSRSIALLKDEIGADWTSNFVEAYCFAAVKLDPRKPLAWPTASDLARIVCSEILIDRADDDSNNDPPPSVVVEAKIEDLPIQEPKDLDTTLTVDLKIEVVPAMDEDKSLAQLGSVSLETESDQPTSSLLDVSRL